MTFEELIIRNRSYRRFDESKRLDADTLRSLVDIARRTPSAANRQPLKYVLVHEPEACGRLFPNLSWAGALKDWDGPAERCVLEEARPGGDVTYWRDADSVHHVPKRPLDEVILDL